MFAKLLALFRRKEAQAVADFSNLVERVRAKVVSEADVVFVSIKDASAQEKAEAKRILEAVAPDIKFIIHDERMKVSAVIKQLEAKVKAKISKAKPKR